MGYIRHDAIIVTTWDDEQLAVARDQAIALGLRCTEIIASPVNSYHTFVIVPDGSKEGWETSARGDAARAAWIAWARAQLEHCVYLDWAHVTYGGDNPEHAEVVDHNERDANN